jgi:hypothetical protein
MSCQDHRFERELLLLPEMVLTRARGGVSRTLVFK